MPPLTRWMVRAGLAYLVLGALLSGIQAIPPAAARFSWLAAAAPATTHLWTIGWLTQLIFGVAYWLFPKHRRRPPRGRDSVWWAGALLLNAGLLLRLIGEPWQAQGGAAPAEFLVVVSGAVIWLGGVALVSQVWGRVH